GIYQNDIKKVLAYSTVSQLGYMFIGLGVMAYSSGLFHVITHAFFKALLFLGAGSVIHAMSDEQDIRKMGGLFGKIKITAITFLLGTIAISGIPPFSGFFSKDEILAHTFEHNKLMWGLALLGSFMTAFYMFRLFFVTFFGSFRGSKEQESHLHESPSSMTIPLIVLSVLAMLGGLIGLPVVFHLPHALATFLEPIFVGSKSVNPTFGEVHLSHATEWILMGVSVSVAAVAILFAYVKFGKGNNVPKEDIEMTGVAQVVYQKYYIDEAYDTVFVKSSVFLSNFFAKVIDTKLIDGLVNGIGALTVTLSGYIRRIQTGATGVYVFAMVVGIVVVFVVSFAPDLVQTFLHLGK
ncbi:MAG: proton-conducting transporter membrane subunit, partial [Spirosomataceae bacterium]